MVGIEVDFEKIREKNLMLLPGAKIQYFRPQELWAEYGRLSYELVIVKEGIFPLYGNITPALAEGWRIISDEVGFRQETGLFKVFYDPCEFLIIPI